MTEKKHIWSLLQFVKILQVINLQVYMYKNKNVELNFKKF